MNPDGSPYRLSKEEADRLLVDPFTRKAGYLVDLVEARLFYPGSSNARPFEFVPESFAKRKAILEENERSGQYNIAEKIIKISLGGLSGKVAQSIGGSETKPPGCFNVFYAGAIRAGTRRAIGEAALQAPHEIVQFCTDAVFSKIPLVLDEGKELGQWEKEEIKGLLTVQSGIYSYKQNKQAKNGDLEETIENKARGFAVSSVDLETIESRLEQEGIPDQKRKMLAFREVLLNKVPAAWKQAALNNDGTINVASPAIDLTLRTFMTGGSAVAGKARFDLIGRWAEVPKRMNVHTPGPKRRLLEQEDCDGNTERVGRMYWSINDAAAECRGLVSAASINTDAARCHVLVPTAPARPEGNTWGVMSLPHIPKWYEGKAKLENDWTMEEDLESEEIALGDHDHNSQTERFNIMTQCQEPAAIVARKVANTVRLTHGEEAAKYVEEIALAYWGGGAPILTEAELIDECSIALREGKFDDLESQVGSIEQALDAHWNYKNGRTTIDGYPREGYIQLAAPAPSRHGQAPSPWTPATAPQPMVVHRRPRRTRM